MVRINRNSWSLAKFIRLRSARLIRPISFRRDTGYGFTSPAAWHHITIPIPIPAEISRRKPNLSPQKTPSITTRHGLHGCYCQWCQDSGVFISYCKFLRPYSGCLSSEVENITLYVNIAIQVHLFPQTVSGFFNTIVRNT